MNPDLVERVCAARLAELGFRKRRRTWIIERDETIGVLNLQHSAWSPLYYLNIGIWVKRLGKMSERPTNDAACHIRNRAEDLAPRGWQLQARKALDLEARMSESNRATMILKLLDKVALPWLEKLRSVDQICDLLRRGKLDSWGANLVTLATLLPRKQRKRSAVESPV